MRERGAGLDLSSGVSSEIRLWICLLGERVEEAAYFGTPNLACWERQIVVAAAIGQPCSSCEESWELPWLLSRRGRVPGHALHGDSWTSHNFRAPDSRAKLCRVINRQHISVITASPAQHHDGSRRILHKQNRDNGAGDHTENIEPASPRSTTLPTQQPSAPAQRGIATPTTTGKLCWRSDQNNGQEKGPC